MAGLLGLRWSFVVHAAGGLAVLGIALVLSIYKPTGRTPWSARGALAILGSRTGTRCRSERLLYSEA
jgi:hypothetical protein